VSCSAISSRFFSATCPCSSRFTICRSCSSGSNGTAPSWVNQSTVTPLLSRLLANAREKFIRSSKAGAVYPWCRQHRVAVGNLPAIERLSQVADCLYHHIGVLDIDVSRASSRDYKIFRSFDLCAIGSNGPELRRLHEKTHHFAGVAVRCQKDRAQAVNQALRRQLNHHGSGRGWILFGRKGGEGIAKLREHQSTDQQPTGYRSGAIYARFSIPISRRTQDAPRL
jgi:hypothetical protein